MKFVYGSGVGAKEKYSDVVIQCIPNSVSYSYTITFSFICILELGVGFFENDV